MVMKRRLNKTLVIMNNNLLLIYSMQSTDKANLGDVGHWDKCDDEDACEPEIIFETQVALTHCCDSNKLNLTFCKVDTVKPVLPGPLLPGTLLNSVAAVSTSSVPSQKSCILS